MDSSIRAKDQAFMADGLVIIGNGNPVYGPNSTVTGNNNIIYGPNSTVAGNNNTTKHNSRNNTVTDIVVRREHDEQHYHFGAPDNNLQEQPNQYFGRMEHHDSNVNNKDKVDPNGREEKKKKKKNPSTKKKAKASKVAEEIGSDLEAEVEV